MASPSIRRISEARNALAMSKTSTAPRHRRFKVTSKLLTRTQFLEGVDRPNVKRYVGVVHDRDGVDPHVQGCIELVETRTVATVERMFGCDVQVQPLVNTKGDPHSWARYIRYLLHESPYEQAKGKARYEDEEIFATPGYDWRAEVDALTSKEGYKVPLLEEIKSKLMVIELTPLDVKEMHPELYAKNYAAINQAYEHSGSIVRQLSRRLKDRLCELDDVHKAYPRLYAKFHEQFEREYEKGQRARREELRRMARVQAGDAAVAVTETSATPVQVLASPESRSRSAATPATAAKPERPERIERLLKGVRLRVGSFPDWRLVEYVEDVYDKAMTDEEFTDEENAQIWHEEHGYVLDELRAELTGGRLTVAGVEMVACACGNGFAPICFGAEGYVAELDEAAQEAIDIDSMGW